MVNLKDILDLPWVNVILFIVVAVIIAVLGVNSFYLYKKSKDTDNKLSNRWNTVLLWVNIGCGGLAIIIIIYFVWKIFSNIIGTRSVGDIFDSIQEALKTRLAVKPAPVVVPTRPVLVTQTVPVAKTVETKPTVKFELVSESEL